MSDSPYAPTTAPLEKEEVAAYIVTNHQPEEKKIASFVIDDHSKNTASNHYKESTITVPFLVRKTHSRDLVPRPWTSLKQLIVATYCSFLCCCLTGALANKFAWEAQRKRELGLLSETKKYARWAAFSVYVSVVLGMCLAITFTFIVLCGVKDMC